MKVTAVLAATASANVTNFIVENWWNQAVQVFNFASENWAAFAQAADSVPDSEWQPLWNFCNADGDDFISGEELTQCAAAAAEYVGMSEATQGFLYNFGVKYWDTVDYDGDGSLNYDEYRYTMAAFAATDAGVVLEAFDANDDGILEGEELTAWRTFIQNALSQNNWNPSDADLAALKAAWANAQVDGDDNTASRMEISRFIVGTWNVLIN